MAETEPGTPPVRARIGNTGEGGLRQPAKRLSHHPRDEELPINHLKAEDALDLSERSRRENHRRSEDEREDEPEAKAGPPLLAVEALAGRTAGAVQPVGTLDGLRIEWR